MNENCKLKGVLEVFERKVGETEWTKIREEHNTIMNTGLNVIANRLTAAGTYSATTFTFFAWGDGTTTPTAADTAATFYADCSNSDTKAVTTIETYDTTNKMQQWSCFLSSTDNAVATIWKFALMNADPGTVMFNTILFGTPISKDNLTELYFRYRLYLAEG